MIVVLDWGLIGVENENHWIPTARLICLVRALRFAGSAFVHSEFVGE